ncbi:hypothetical protein DFJ73DRAFT_117489 [Zopfochytrium polystomum]|nr:hypothetical protein DFJ73DRAFT_117489 [Zopfochytrium polystomum]
MRPTSLLVLLQQRSHQPRYNIGTSVASHSRVVHILAHHYHHLFFPSRAPPPNLTRTLPPPFPPTTRPPPPPSPTLLLSLRPPASPSSSPSSSTSSSSTSSASKPPKQQQHQQPPAISPPPTASHRRLLPATIGSPTPPQDRDLGHPDRPRSHQAAAPTPPPAPPPPPPLSETHPPPPPPGVRLGPSATMLIEGVRFDASGAVSKVQERVKKHEFCAAHSLQPRDLIKVGGGLVGVKRRLTPTT